MWFTDAPPVWHAGAESDSFLQILLVFVGIPVAIVLLVGLLAAARSIASGDRHKPGQGDASDNWFGDRPLEPGDERRELTSSGHDPAPSDRTGGASARW